MDLPFQHVVEQHGAAVLRVCRAVLDGADAEDAWSETFLSALAAYPRLAPGSDVRAWLVTIAHRKSVDVHRARQRRAIPMAELPAAADVGGDPAATSLHDNELWDAIRALPVRQRTAIACHYLGGLSYAQVGAVLECSADAARRSAADGMATLRATYTREACHAPIH